MKLAGVLSLLEAGAGGGASGFDVTAVMTDAVTTVQGQLFSVLGIVVPSIVLVTGAIVGIRFGISWLRRLRGS
ncbi:MAG: hypothetical protein HFI51_00920 [Lachnospiraceae bacterium]|jgi:hypothetical protein|nr:hypothetical protein [Lachnospiraceae bacterium]